jgi:hypothetical protein
LLACGGNDDVAVDATTTTTEAVAPTTTAATVPIATGAFRVAPGRTAVVGAGELHRYTVEVENGVDVDVSQFAAAVDDTLGAPMGWTADGRVALQRVDDRAAAGFRVRLATPATTDALCAPLRTNGIYSCRQGADVVINLVRWLEGAEPSGLSLADYRIYVISHEVGHALGHGHVGCPGAGRPAPVMMQQTKSIGACSPNPWPFP